MLVARYLIHTGHEITDQYRRDWLSTATPSLSLVIFYFRSLSFLKYCGNSSSLVQLFDGSGAHIVHEMWCLAHETWPRFLALATIIYTCIAAIR